jgi:hypothetical protein
MIKMIIYTLFKKNLGVLVLPIFINIIICILFIDTVTSSACIFSNDRRINNDVDWVHVAQDWEPWLTFLNIVMNF